MVTTMPGSRSRSLPLEAQLARFSARLRLKQANDEPAPTPKCPYCADTKMVNFVEIWQAGKLTQVVQLRPDQLPAQVISEQYPYGHIAVDDCVCVKQERAERRAATEEDARRKYWNSTKIPAKYTGLTFNTFEALSDAARAGKDEALTYAKALADADITAGGLVLSGSFGCGKTGLATAILIERAANGQQVLWTRYSDMMAELRDTQRPDSETSYQDLVNALYKVPTLLVDDFGYAENPKVTDWEVQRVADLIEKRAGEDVITVITTNMSAQQFETVFGTRTFDRIVQDFYWCDIGGVNLRRTI